MKSEPNSYSIKDLKRDKKAFWDGVRNYQARNFMINDMKIGDKTLFYHSNSKPSGVTGLAKVCKKAEPDLTALDKNSIYYDPKATKQNPRWKAVTVEFVEIFDKIISIQELRHEKALKNMSLLKKGQRLSVMPITKSEYEHIVKMAKK
ncbi:MAG: EVE domain-containing protein [Bdellovibrionaceae bacterium]|nr:EVE domain-containing protein [Pseudobdellovibrionaceae bacterium]